MRYLNILRNISINEDISAESQKILKEILNDVNQVVVELNKYNHSLAGEFATECRISRGRTICFDKVVELYGLNE